MTEPKWQSQCLCPPGVEAALECPNPDIWVLPTTPAYYGSVEGAKFLNAWIREDLKASPLQFTCASPQLKADSFLPVTAYMIILPL